MNIVTDSAADMPVEETAALNVTAAPLIIQFPDKEVNSHDISADDFYNRLEKMRPAIPTTAQPSPALFTDIYRDVAKRDPEILSIHVSSGLSGTINSARLGAEAAAPEARVTLWDSMTLSGGERFQVLAAAHAVRAGWPLDAILQRLAEIRDKNEIIYTLETLEYLARGGRIGRVQAAAGAILGIKPIIRVDHADGKYSNVARNRTVNGAIGYIVDHLRSMYGDAPMWITVLHGRYAEKAELLKQQLSGKLNIAKIEVMRISPVLGVHTGPGIVGLAAVPMSLMADLVTE
jgi:DegV family protein with EDD domain